MSKRGSAISVPESWLEACQRWRKEQDFTVKETGRHLARVTKRGRPFAVATVHRYLAGSLVTNELTQAFAKAMGVPPPVQIDNDLHRRWYELGVRLDHANEAVFATEIDRLEQLVAVVEELRDLKVDE